MHVFPSCFFEFNLMGKQTFSAYLSFGPGNPFASELKFSTAFKLASLNAVNCGPVGPQTARHFTLRFIKNL